MEVKIIPVSGCMMVFLGVMTLGIAPLAQWIMQKSWPKLVDEQGLVTRGGSRIAWGEFTKAVKVLTRVTRGSSAATEHYELFSPKGKVVVAAYRLENGAAVTDYVWQRLPDSAKYKPA
jgi:hypothetical protein